MAKPLGEKARVIRKAIHEHPSKGNTELATMLMDSQERLDDRLEIKAADVAQQRVALKKLEEGQKERPTEAREPARTESKPVGPVRQPEAVKLAPVPEPAAQSTKPADMVAATMNLAQQFGGLDELKRMVEVLEKLQGK